jgi:hypothetical protein
VKDRVLTIEKSQCVAPCRKGDENGSGEHRWRDWPPPDPGPRFRLRFVAHPAILASTLTTLGGSPCLPSNLSVLSAARYSIVRFGSLDLPFILPHNLMLYWVLRQAQADGPLERRPAK